jgi:hypothetical protein
MEDNDETQKQQAIRSIQDVLGVEVSVDKIRYFLQGANWDMQTALNHILNDIENERSKLGVRERKKNWFFFFCMRRHVENLRRLTSLPTLFRLSFVGIETLSASTSTPPMEKVLFELAEEVKCPLCLSYFNMPVILNCFHTYCTHCLEGFCNSANEDQSEMASLACPLCRMVTPLPESGGKKISALYTHSWCFLLLLLISFFFNSFSFIYYQSVA